MFIPAYFRVSDDKKIIKFIQDNNFGIIFSLDPQNSSIVTTHLPFLIEKDNFSNFIMLCHFSKSNNHWRLIESNSDVQILFNGPHGYISPKYYINPSVPTWNYTAVHVTGKASIISSHDETYTALEKLVNFHEVNKTGWKMKDVDISYIEKLIKGIVCVQIKDLKFEAKFKLNQNKKDEDIKSVIEHLDVSENGKELGLFMKNEFFPSKDNQK
jgi:transcriptional regulator